MKRMKKLFLLLMVFALLLPLAQPARAAHVSADEAIDTLTALGLVRGTGNGFEPERSATRAEALAMLLRLLGEEEAALSAQTPCPFSDGGWAAPLIGYAAQRGLVRGQSASLFGSDQPVSCRDWLTMLLRALGYSDAEGDFSWAESIAFADGVGLTHGEYTTGSAFLREDLALTSYTALTLPLKGAAQTLAEKLYRLGVLSAGALRATRLAWVLSADKPVYDAMGIHELGASAVFFVEVFESEDSLAEDEPDNNASGFFVTADGVAYLSYHEIDGMAYARATTLDGHRYEITGVLGYDPLWDYAVVRVSRTDENGNTVRAFPYLDLGDSDALAAGEAVYTLSNALGLIDSVTDGVLSNRSRNVDDPDYRCLQFSAPISPGSSGGALLNRHGEVIGIIFAMYTRGQNMNIAVPVNALAGVPLTGAGIPLRQVKETEDAKKAAATLTVSETELVLGDGGEAEVMVTHDCPGTAAIQYKLSESSVVECEWGSFVTKRSVPITIRAVGNGECDVTITFANGTGNEEASAVIHVTVSGVPEKAAEDDLPGGVTGE